MKVRVTFNDGKTFSHYAFVVFRVSLSIAYICSGLLIFSLAVMNLSIHFQDIGPEILHDWMNFYFPVDCMNCDEID